MVDFPGTDDRRTSLAGPHRRVENDLKYWHLGLIPAATSKATIKARQLHILAQAVAANQNRRSRMGRGNLLPCDEPGRN
jgi:hypothetical protein